MSATKAEWIGMKIAEGRYTIARRIGEGGMGTVYRAWDANLQTDVIIKVPKRSMLDDPEFRGRFQREIRSLVRLSHPNIVKIQDVGEFDRLPFCVMQFLSGGDLKSRCTRTLDGLPQPMPVDSLTTWLPGVADALDFIHKKSFVHRDVKPPNILFDANGNAYLSDFGVAKVVAEKAPTEVSLTGTGMVLGTPEYMSPEMVLGDKFDGRADQYALAVTVYETLAGFPPLTGPTPSAILVKQTTDVPLPLCDVTSTVSRSLSDAVMKALAKKPDERFPDCRSFAQAVLAGTTGTVEMAGSGLGMVAGVGHVAELVTGAAPETVRSSANPTTTLKTTGAPTVRRHRSVLGLVSVIVAGIAGLSWWLMRPSIEATDLSASKLIAPESIKLTPEDAERIEEEARLATHVESHDFLNSVGMQMVCVRPGKFRNHDESDWNEIEVPFWIADSEVTVAQYLHYCDVSGNGKPGYPVWLDAPSGTNSLQREESPYWPLREEIKQNGAPVVGITVAQMSSFCDWLSNQEGELLNYSLPSPEQWVCAYRAKTSTHFYWGNEFDVSHANLKVSADPFPTIALVGQSQERANPWGLRDMAGNVWEMTIGKKVFGGGWDSDSVDDARPIGVSPEVVPSPSIGFRVVGILKVTEEAKAKANNERKTIPVLVTFHSIEASELPNLQRFTLPNVGEVRVVRNGFTAITVTEDGALRTGENGGSFTLIFQRPLPFVESITVRPVSEESRAQLNVGDGFVTLDSGTQTIPVGKQISQIAIVVRGASMYELTQFTVRKVSK